MALTWILFPGAPTDVWPMFLRKDEERLPKQIVYIYIYSYQYKYMQEALDQS